MRQTLAHFLCFVMQCLRLLTHKALEGMDWSFVIGQIQKCVQPTVWLTICETALPCNWTGVGNEAILHHWVASAPSYVSDRFPNELITSYSELLTLKLLSKYFCFQLILPSYAKWILQTGFNRKVLLDGGIL